MTETQQLLKFFFEAMNAGWAQETIEKIGMPNMPCYKAIPFRSGNLYLLDNYCVGANDKSAGTTTIWLGDVPIWFMSYGGYYKKSAIPFLKKALKKTYEAHRFVGARGPLVYAENHLVYVNRPNTDDFKKFDGREEIFDTKTGLSLGWHEYWGMTLK